MEDPQCSICKANFRSEAMVGSKCETCDKLYPDAKTLEDIADPNKERARLLNEPVIREIVYDILAEAGIVRKRCETCQKKFFPKSPAQKFCSVCRFKTKVTNDKSDSDKEKN